MIEVIHINNDLMFSSDSNEWYTDQAFYDDLNSVFNFTLDPCSTHENHKCDTYFTIEDDGLTKDWSGHTVFMNPPYSKPESACSKNCKKKSCIKRGYHNDKYIPGQEDWIKKAFNESNNNTTVVALLPSRTDTIVQHAYIFRRAYAILFIKGRLRFGGCKDAAPFPSQLAIYSDTLTTRQMSLLSKYGHLILL